MFWLICNFDKKKKKQFQASYDVTTLVNTLGDHFFGNQFNSFITEDSKPVHLLCKSFVWFLNDRDFRHEIVNLYSPLK